MGKKRNIREAPAVPVRPDPDARKRPPTTYLPGVHDPKSPIRPGAKKVKKEMNAGGVAGYQMPISAEEAIRRIVRKRVKEIVRKKKGGGGYILYSPNQGKKHPPKPVGEYPTRALAKRAELMRFPPKDPKKLKRLRKQIDRQIKARKRESRDPLEALLESLAEAAMDAMDSSEEETQDEAPPDDAPPTVHGQKAPDDVEPAPPPSPTERPAVPPQEESRWDELLSKLSDVALKKDVRLRKLTRRVDAACDRALENAVRSLRRALGGGVTAGKTGRDRLGRPYITATIDVDGHEVGPVYMYVKGETLHVVSNGDVKSDIMKLDPIAAKEVKEALRDLPDRFNSKDLERAIAARDSYLEDMEVDLDEYLADLGPLELSMLKRLVADKYMGDTTG